jgi:hypothetical protein
MFHYLSTHCASLCVELAIRCNCLIFNGLRHMDSARVRLSSWCCPIAFGWLFNFAAIGRRNWYRLEAGV